MSELKKINTGLAKTMATNMANQFKANVENNYAISTAISNIKAQSIETESFDLNSLETSESIEITKMNTEEYKLTVRDYEKMRERELEEYNIILESINKELEELDKALHMTVKTMFTGKAIDVVYSTKLLDALVREKTKFNSYEEYQNYVDNLKNDKSLLEQAIRKTNELKDCASYTLLPYLDSYQQYNNDKTYSLQDLNNKDLNISPLKKFETLTQFYSRYNIKIEHQDKLEALSNASKYAPELSKMYNYLYDTEGLESATEYLTKMESTINQVNGKAKADAFLNKLNEEENPMDAISNHFKTSGKGLLDGAESFFEGVAAWLKSSDIYTADEYESMYILEALQTNPNYNKLLDNNYEISQSIGNMLPSIAISTALSPVAGAEMAKTAATVSMGVSAGGKSYHSALVEGQSTEKAVAYGVLSGLSEAGLEKVMGGISGISDVEVKNLKTFAQAMLKESIEEGTQEYADALLRTGIFGESFDLEEVTKNAGKSALYGAITAGIMNTPALGVSEINRFQENRNMMQGDLSQVTSLNETEEIIGNNIIEKNTDKVKLANEKKLNSTEIGRASCRERVCLSV